MIRDFERWPKYKELYIRAFEKMIENHPGQIKILNPDEDTKFSLLDDLSTPCGAVDGMVDPLALNAFSDGGLNVTNTPPAFSRRRCSTVGSRRQAAEFVFGHWLELGAM